MFSKKNWPRLDLNQRPNIVRADMFAYSDDLRIKIQELRAEYAEKVGLPKDQVILICAKVEAELAALDELEQKEYLQDLGLSLSGLDILVKTVYERLDFSIG